MAEESEGKWGGGGGEPVGLAPGLLPLLKSYNKTVRIFPAHG